MELIIKNQELYEEKHKLEEKAAELSEALLVNSKVGFVLKSSYRRLIWFFLTASRRLKE